MLSRRLAIPLLLLALLLVSGCHQASKQSASVTNSAEPTVTQPASGSISTANNAGDAASAPAKPDSEVAEQAPQKLIVPEGTRITVRLQQPLSSRSAYPGQRFEAVLDEPVVVGNQVILPAGAPVEGHVVLVRRSGRLRHPGALGLTLDKVTVNQQIVPLTTAHVVAQGSSHKKRNWAWIGGGSGGGALIGGLAAGGKGALIGSGIGAVAGTTTAFITGKKDVVFGTERRLRFRLNQNVSLFS